MDSGLLQDSIGCRVINLALRDQNSATHSTFYFMTLLRPKRSREGREEGCGRGVANSCKVVFRM